MSARIAIVAALEREVAPLIRTWRVRSRQYDRWRYRFFESETAVLVCGGIGAEAARRAAEAIVQEFQPARLLSVGFAGALDPGLRVGEVIEPRTVIDAGDGSRMDTGSGEGVVVSFRSVATPEQKKKLRQAYDARAVEMEAAAVAQAAQAHAIAFSALKAISDESDFSLPGMERFVSGDGQFRATRFAFHVAWRPWLWPTTAVLARNSARASRALCVAIGRYLDRQASIASTESVEADRG